MPTPPRLEPDPWSRSVESTAVTVNITRSTMPPRSGKRKVVSALPAETNHSRRKYQTQASAVMP